MFFSSNNMPRVNKKRSIATLPRPVSAQAKLNRANRVRKMTAANTKRRLACENDRKRKLQIQKDKEFIRQEKKRIKETIRNEREKLAKEKKKILQLKRDAQVALKCSPEKSVALSVAMTRLVPSSAEISSLSHEQYVKLRSEMSKLLSGVLAYAKKCNAGFAANKRSKPAAKRRASPLNIPVRDIFIPDIGVHVPDRIPVTEKEFDMARKRLKNGQQHIQPQKKKKEKKRIKPVFVSQLGGRT